MCTDEDDAAALARADSGAIEPHSGPVDEDEFDPVDGWDASSSGSTSVTPSVYDHEYAHGRRYHSYRNGRYPIPNDNIEQNREDMKHAMMLELTDGRLFYSPIGNNPQKILDIGTGTGIWAIEVGDLYPSAIVTGIDLSPIQPLWTPPNVRFLVDDAEDDWLNGTDFDLVHFRTMSAVLKNLPKVVDMTYQNIKPGGWVEFQELHAWPCCDDGTMRDDDVLKRFYELAYEAFQLFKMDIHRARDLKPILEGAGFKNVHCVVKKVPVGTWARDPIMRVVGLYLKMAILSVIGSFAGKPFEALGISAEERQVWLAMVRKTVEDTSIHRYFNFYFWYAQKED